MDRKEFIAQAEQIESATAKLAVQIEALSEQAEKHRHNWPGDIAGCVKELQEYASEMEGIGSSLPFVFKTDAEIRSS